jgi:hypothetical protein
MDRLKEEWEKAQIPEEVRFRARNLAWNKIQNPVSSTKRYGWMAAISTITVVIIIFASIRTERGTQPGKFTRSAEKVISHSTDSVATPKTQPVDLAPLPKAVAVRRSSARPKIGNMAADQHERVVLNFRLPESGAQMIWIMDSNFQLDGGTQ